MNDAILHDRISNKEYRWGTNMVGWLSRSCDVTAPIDDLGRQWNCS